MKHQSPKELAAAATTFSLPPQSRLTRRERIERWASLLERHEGSLNALRRVEYLSPEDRRAYRGADTPLTVAYDDPVLREEGLKSDRLGDTMDFFELSDHDAHLLLCDCRYQGTMTGSLVARRLRQHTDRKERRSRFLNAVGRLFGLG